LPITGLQPSGRRNWARRYQKKSTPN